MSGLLQEPGSNKTQSFEEDSSRWIIFIAVAVVFTLAVGTTLLFRPKPAGPPSIHPYASSLQLSNIKMSTSQNFVGATVTYVDGTVTNTGGKTVTHAVTHVVFKDSLGQVAQSDDMPIRVLQTGGPYDDDVDLATQPIAPGQSRQFRLTFEHVSTEWDGAYPQLQITDVTVKDVSVKDPSVATAK